MSVRLSRFASISLMVCLVCLAAPVTASVARARPAPEQGLLIPAAGGGPVMEAAGVGHMLDMDFKHLMALVIGVGIGTAVGEIVGLGGELRIVGLVGGAVLGETWYRKGWWPFTKHKSWWYPF